MGHDEISNAELIQRRNASVNGIDDNPPPPPSGNLPDIIHDFTPKTVADLPATLEEAGYFYPEFTNIIDLPGHIFEPVRIVTRQVMRAFNMPAKLEDGATMSFFAGQEPDEINRMVNWIRSNGVLEDSARLDMSNLWPGYKPKCAVWKSLGYDWLLVHEDRESGAPAGEQKYIYVFPGGRGVHVGGDAAPKQLESRKGKIRNR